jgi:hypothetical protein
LLLETYPPDTLAVVAYEFNVVVSVELDTNDDTNAEVHACVATLIPP